jgi:hypothetical protein
MWVAQSRQAKAQLVLMRPTMKAMPLEAQPVLLTKLAKTNWAVSWLGALAGTTMRMIRKEKSEQ